MDVFIKEERGNEMYLEKCVVVQDMNTVIKEELIIADEGDNEQSLEMMPRKILGLRPAKKRQVWEKSKMIEAVSSIREKKMGLKKAAKRFQVPKTTLRRLVLQTDVSLEEVVKKKLGRKPTLPECIEKELVDYLLFMEAKFYGFTQMDVRKMAYQLATRNGIKNPFQGSCAGRAWVRHFLKRYADKLPLRKPIWTSYARALNFSRENVGKFYDLLEAEYEKYNYPPNRVWNVDETGLSIVQSKIPQIIGLKGKRQICSLTAAEQGSLVTVICSMSAGGSYVPPMLIFPMSNYTAILEKGAPPGSIGRAHPSGWVQAHHFMEWFQHFIDKTVPTEKSPVLLILDGHYSHTRNLDVIDKARKNNVSILSLPSHTTHKLQPLDRTFMGSLKTHYSDQIRQWMLHQDKLVGPYDIAELFGKAYLECTTESTAVNGFRVTGIMPFNRNVFNDAEFLAAEHDVQNEPPPVDQGSIVSAQPALMTSALIPEHEHGLL